MRKEYGRALRKLFAERMKQALPDYPPQKVSTIHFIPGDRAFCRGGPGDLRRWIVLSPSPKGLDQFTVMLGWSRLGRYPELSMVPCAERPSPDRAEFNSDEYLTRLPWLWTDVDRWWVVREFEAPTTPEALLASMAPVPADEALAAVAPQVDDAMERLLEYGAPYLEALEG